ncbi:MAG TPA: hypothetical protein VGB17_15560 [Pyrinomonadaceae bacterium]|jgi:hypothetical protein
MKLNKRQKEHLLALISEGLESDEINQRASKFKPPYSVSRQQVGHYRKTRGVDVEEIKKESEQSALKVGFARKEKRVESLNKLAEALEKDLLEDGRLWLDDVKAVGSGDFQQIVDFQSFNGGELQQFRGVLDDIAKEMGDRRQKVDVKVDANEALAALLGVSPDELPVPDNAHS